MKSKKQNLNNFDAAATLGEETFAAPALPDPEKPAVYLAKSRQGIGLTHQQMAAIAQEIQVCRTTLSKAARELGVDHKSLSYAFRKAGLNYQRIVPFVNVVRTHQKKKRSTWQLQAGRALASPTKNWPILPTKSAPARPTCYAPPKTWVYAERR